MMPLDACPQLKPRWQLQHSRKVLKILTDILAANTLLLSARCQVTARPPSANFNQADIPETRPSWRSRFRALFCCLAPAVNDQYYRSDADPALIRPPQPPTPPPLVGDAVLGPIAGAASLSNIARCLGETMGWSCRCDLHSRRAALTQVSQGICSIDFSEQG